jgi:hypothetical protein
MCIPRKAHNHRRGPSRLSRLLFEIKWRIVFPFRPALDFIRYLRAYKEPHIVSTPGTLGGSPRLDGTRLNVEFFVWNRDRTPEWFETYYGSYVPRAHVDFMFAVVDAVVNALEQGVD